MEIFDVPRFTFKDLTEFDTSEKKKEQCLAKIQWCFFKVVPVPVPEKWSVHYVYDCYVSKNDIFLKKLRNTKMTLPQTLFRKVKWKSVHFQHKFDTW